MKYSLRPVIPVRDLENALCERYSTHDFDNLADLMWSGEYMNESYKMLPFREKGEVMQDEIYDFYDEKEKKKNELTNMVRVFLNESFPEFDSILVNVSW